MYQCREQQEKATGHLPVKPANNVNFDKVRETLKLLSASPVLKDCKQDSWGPCRIRALEEVSPIWIISHRTVFWSTQVLLDFQVFLYCNLHIYRGTTGIHWEDCRTAPHKKYISVTSHFSIKYIPNLYVSNTHTHQVLVLTSRMLLTTSDMY